MDTNEHEKFKGKSKKNKFFAAGNLLAVSVSA